MAKQGDFFVEIGSRLRADFAAAVSRAKQAFYGLGSVAAKTLSVIGQKVGLGSFSSFTSAISDGLDKAAAYDKAVSRLAATLRASGEGGRKEAAAFGEFATKLAKASGNSTDAVLSSMQMAKSSGVAADQLRNVAEAATAVANASGSDLGTATGAVTALLNGEAGAIQNLIPEFRRYGDAASILGKLNEKKAEWNRAGAEKQGGLSDELNKAKEAADGAMRSIGQALLPAVKAVSGAIQELGPIITTVAGIVGEVLAKLAQMFAFVIKVSDKAGELAGKALFGDTNRKTTAQYGNRQKSDEERTKNFTEAQKALERQTNEFNKQHAGDTERDQAAAKAAEKTNAQLKAQQAVNKEKEKGNQLQFNANALLHAEFTTATDLYKQTALRLLQQAGTQTAGTAAAVGKNIAAQTAARDPALAEIAASTKATADAVTAMAQTQAMDSAHWNR